MTCFRVSVYLVLIVTFPLSITVVALSKRMDDLWSPETSVNMNADALIFVGGEASMVSDAVTTSSPLYTPG